MSGLDTLRGLTTGSGARGTAKGSALARWRQSGGPPSLSPVLRSALVFAIGVSGSLASIRGWGPVIIGPEAQSTASWVIVVSGVGFVLLAAVDRGGVLGAVRLALLVGLPMVTWGNAGRAYGVVTACGLVVLHAALVDRWRSRCSSPGGAEAAVFASWLVLVAQLAVGAGRPGAALSVILMGAVVLVTHRLYPGWFAPVVVLLERSPYRADGMVKALLGGTRRADRSMSVLRSNWQAVLVIVVMTAAMAPVFWRYAAGGVDVTGTTDFETHLDHAARVELVPLRVTAPHPVFHVAVRLLSILVDQHTAATVVLSLSTALTVVVLVWLSRWQFAGRSPMGPALGAAFAAGYFVVESPAQVAAALRWGTSSSWAPMNHMVLSPTDTLLVPFAVALVLTCAAVLRPAGHWVPPARFVALLTVIATLVKPSVTLPLLIAFPALAAVLRRPIRWRLVAAFLAPAAVIVLWQTWFLEAGVAEEVRAGIEIRPFETLRLLGLGQASLLIVSPVLVVALCLWAGWRRYLREPAVLLSIGCLAVAVAMLVLLNETGSRAADGTFAKPAFVCWVALHVVSWRFLTAELVVQARARQAPIWSICAVGFLGVCVVAGVLTYLGDVGLMHLPIRA